MVRNKFYALIFIFSIFFSSVPDISSLKLQDSKDVIINDSFWKDIDGKYIYSQGEGIFKFGETYYWYEVHYKGAEIYAAPPTNKNSDRFFVSITCYSSKVLINSKIENDVLTPKSKEWVNEGCIGRMGIAYCPTSKQYVLITQNNIVSYLPHVLILPVISK